MEEARTLIRRQGAFVMKVDAFGLCVGRLQQDQRTGQSECRLERYECQQDEEFNLIYQREGVWVEKDLAHLVDVPDDLLEYRAEDDSYLAKGSLVDHLIENSDNLDRDVINFLKSEDKWKYKLSYEYRQRAKRKRELAAHKKRMTRVDFSKEAEEVEEEIQEVDEEDSGQGNQDVDKAGLVKGAFVVFERDHEEILYGQVKRGWLARSSINRSHRFLVCLSSQRQMEALSLCCVCAKKAMGCTGNEVNDSPCSDLNQVVDPTSSTSIPQINLWLYLMNPFPMITLPRTIGDSI